MLTALILLPVFVKGEVKVGFVQSDRIRMEYEDFKEAESQLQLEFQKVQFEYQEMLSQLDSLKETYETQRLMSSPEWRREKEQEISESESRIQTFQAIKVGPEGVDNVAISKGFDFIFDGSVSLLYGKPTFDVTDDVLHELRK